MTEPTPNKVVTKLQRKTIHLSGLNLTSLNNIFHDISVRLNHLEAIGQSPDIKGKRVINFGKGLKDHDGVRRDQVVLIPETAISSASDVSSITLDAGIDQVDSAGFNTKLATLRTEVNAIVDKLNEVIEFINS